MRVDIVAHAAAEIVLADIGLDHADDGEETQDRGDGGYGADDGGGVVCVLQLAADGAVDGHAGDHGCEAHGDDLEHEEPGALVSC